MKDMQYLHGSLQKPGHHVGTWRSYDVTWWCSGSKEGETSCTSKIVSLESPPLTLLPGNAGVLLDDSNLILLSLFHPI